METLLVVLLVLFLLGGGAGGTLVGAGSSPLALSYCDIRIATTEAS